MTITTELDHELVEKVRYMHNNPDKSRFFDPDSSNKLRHHEFAVYLADTFNIKMIDDRLHIYNSASGIYEPYVQKIQKTIINIIPGLKDQQINEVLKRLELVAEEIEHAETRYIAVQNGVLDIKTRELHSFSPNIVLTSKINAQYEPEANDRNVKSFLEILTNGDAEVINLLEEVIGYTIYRRNSFTKSFLMYGSGGNGKSTFLNMLSEFIGQENISALSLDDLSERFSTSQLHNKLANIGDDIPPTTIKISSHFKKLSTGDWIKGEFKGEDPFFFRSYATLIFSANKIPRINDNSEGIFDRLAIIPFKYKIRGTKNEDPSVEDKLKTDYARSTLLNIAIRGLDRLIENKGFTMPGVVQEEIESFKVYNNPVAEWLEEYEEQGKSIEGLPISSAYADYKDWCEDNNYRYPLSKKKLSQELPEHGYFTKKAYQDGRQQRIVLRLD